MPRSPSISVCNIALSEVRAGSIVAIDEGSTEANACATHYDESLQLLFEAHPWTFAIVQADLALLDVNDRLYQWLYAYAKPDDMAGATALLWPVGTVGLNPVYAPWYPWGDGCRNDYRALPFPLTAFQIAGDTIYSNIEAATIQYVSRDVEEALMPATFKRALALELASRLAFALVNDRALKGDLIQQAEAAKRRAMAEDLNSFPRRDHMQVDEVARARNDYWC